MQLFRSCTNFEKDHWQSPVFAKDHVRSPRISVKSGLHHECFSDNFEKFFDKLFFTVPVKTHIQRYL